MKGTVYLVGAGPGDPGLLTMRGAELLARADVVVHDRLSDPSLLALAPPGAEHVDVGKQPDDRGDQGAINRLLVAKAREGLAVVRLKGGDPFVFGRGGEEAIALRAAGVPYEVVPGVTSAIAAPAFAGVPVTHRGLSGCVTVVAGHRRSVEAPAGEGGANWDALAAAGGTIVVLMGAANRGGVARRLIEGGLPPATPVMAVQWGTEPYQSVVRTTLGELHATPVQPPVTIVVGQVAALDLSWQEARPLAGKTVVVTRAEHQGAPLAADLRDLGARVLEAPAIMFAPPAGSGAALGAAVEKLGAGGYAWAVFTSANAVERFFELVPDARAFGVTKVGAVGPATAEALGRYRVVADLVAADHGAGGLVSAFPAPAAGTVLLPQAAGARPALRQGLEARGWAVEVVETYRTVPRPLPPEVLAAAGRSDAVCFASPSAVSSYLDQAASAGAPLPPVVACIGPTTAAAARQRGLKVAAEASEHTAGGLAEALVAVLSRPAEREGLGGPE